MSETNYPCGCKSVNGIVIARCAWAAATKARIAELEGNVRLVPVTVTQVEYLPDECARLIEVETYEWADQEEALRLCGELGAHYPSKFAAPTSCGPVGGDS